MRRAGEAGRLNVRIMRYAGGIPAMRAINGGKPSGWLYGDRLRLVGVKLYADGALGSRGAWLKQPYADKPDTRGLQLPDRRANCSSRPTSRRRARLPARDPRHRRCRQRAGHLDLSRSWRKPTAATAAGGSSMSRSSTRPTSRASASAGIIASMQPTHQTSDRLMAEARLGPPRLEGAYAWQTIAEARRRRSPSAPTSRSKAPTPSPASPPRSAGRT